jgi:hypothetical protein
VKRNLPREIAARRRHEAVKAARPPVVDEDLERRRAEWARIDWYCSHDPDDFPEEGSGDQPWLS